MISNIHQIESLVDGFCKLNRKLEDVRWRTNHLNFSSLISGWKTLQIMSRHIDQLTAPDYNVFSVMKNMMASEVKLHSPFLADLFNVHGEHKQGDLFYRELVSLLSLPIEVYQPEDKYWFDVRTEVASGTGGIDILISYKNGAKSFAIAIENKIYAGDQKEQLERYHNYLRAEYGRQFVLVYLTPEGREPTEHSASKDFLNKHNIEYSAFNESSAYKIPLLSYRNHIVRLLQKTVPKIKAAHVRSIVEQYLAVCQEI